MAVQKKVIFSDESGNELEVYTDNVSNNGKEVILSLDDGNLKYFFDDKSELDDLIELLKELREEIGT